MENIKFLASYKDDSVIIEVNSHDDIINAIRRRLSLPGNCLIKLRVFDKEWNEWINKEPSEICDKDRIRIGTEQPSGTLGDLQFVNLPWEVQIGASPTSLSPSASFSDITDSSQLDEGKMASELLDSDSVSEVPYSMSVGNRSTTDSTLLSASNSDNSVSKKPAADIASTESPTLVTDDDQLLKSSASQQKETKSLVADNTVPERMKVVTLKPWPAVFPIPVESMSAALRTSLDAGKFPVEKQRRQMVQVLFDKMSEYVRYPSRSQYEDVAKCLVDRFPCLAFSDIPSVKPHDYWKTKLSDKFRNERKHFGGSHTNPKKKLKVAESTEVGDSEDARSIEMHQSWMKEEVKKRQKNEQKIQRLMEITFHHRRQLVVKDRPMVKQMADIYPALFESAELQREFQRITGKNVLTTLIENVSAMAEKILKVAESKVQQKKKLESLNLELHKIFAVNQSKKKELENCCAIVILTNMLSKEAVIRKAEDSDLTGISSPVLVWVGDTELTATKFEVKAESETFGETTDIINGLATLMATYWTFDMSYPKEGKDFFVFVDTVLLKLSGKPTRAVNSIISRLKSV